MECRNPGIFLTAFAQTNGAPEVPPEPLDLLCEVGLLRQGELTIQMELASH
jgi:hypothetical protein